MGERASELLEEIRFGREMNSNGEPGESTMIRVGLLREILDAAEAHLTSTPQPDTDLAEKVALDCYDAGLIGDGGGGDVGWWQDYIRTELQRAHEFYQGQVDHLPPRTYGDGIEDAAVCAEKLGRMLPEGGPVDAKGWPTTPEGAARHQSFAIAAAIRTLSPSGIEDVREAGGEEDYQLGKCDGRSEAVQEIDLATGGDGEYRYCTDHDPERHCPDPEAMIARIVDRFSDAREALTKAAAARVTRLAREYASVTEDQVAGLPIGHLAAVLRDLSAATLCESASSKIGGGNE